MNEETANNELKSSAIKCKKCTNELNELMEENRKLTEELNRYRLENDSFIQGNIRQDMFS